MKYPRPAWEGERRREIESLDKIQKDNERKGKKPKNKEV